MIQREARPSFMDLHQDSSPRVHQTPPLTRLEPAVAASPAETYKSPFDYQQHSVPDSVLRTQHAARQWRWTVPRWLSLDSLELIVAKFLPLTLHTAALATLIAGMVSTSAPYLSFVQNGGPGRLDMFILNSCATRPDNLTRTCTNQSLKVSFLPSMAQVTDFVPGVVAVQLPFQSTEAPPIILTAAICLFLSLVLYVTLWMLTFYPSTKLLPRAYVDFARYRARQLFLVSGALSFASTILTITISMGLKLYFMGYRNKINSTMELASLYGYVKGDVTEWRAQLGPGFDVLWASTAMQILTVLAVNIALRYGIDERVEWPQDSKETWA
ncbi:hypothetical protein OIV83_000551 [Microbotryomycetes sp. JL201]|nr:hypothetical protein OIV83_000551 [Microbotryomycetes sp. JL201]